MSSCESVASQIPEEIVVEILSRSPLKSLHRFKFVSKSWSSLITHQILPKIPPSPLLGFFHHFHSYRSGPEPSPSYTDDDDDDGSDFFSYVDRNNNARDANISITLRLFFLSWLHHSHAYHFSIVDCCNGLLLCQTKERHYYVCNPATLSYAELPKYNFFPCYCLLDFDPRVSPHYKVIVICMRSGNLSFDVYCSERRRWEKKRADPAVCKGYYYSKDKSHCALWNGALYFYMQRKGSYADEDIQTLRFGLLDGNVGRGVIKFPTGTKKPRDGAFIGRLGNKLCFVGLDGRRLRVWTLRGEHETEWLMEYDSTISGLCSTYGRTCKPLIVGFHPSLEAVLIHLKTSVFTYDLKKMTLRKTCRIAPKRYEQVYGSVFAYSSCSFDLLENRMTAESVFPGATELVTEYNSECGELPPRVDDWSD